MPLEIYKKHVEKIEALLSKPYFKFNPKTQIILVGNHTKLTTQDIQELFELPTLSKFRHKQIKAKNIVVY